MALAADDHIAAGQAAGCHSAAVKGYGGVVRHRALHRQIAGVGCQVGAAEDLGLGGLHEAHAVQLANFAGEQLRGSGILVGGDPRLVLAQVKGHAGMDLSLIHI